MDADIIFAAAAEESRRARLTVRMFIDATANGDIKTMSEILGELEHGGHAGGGWARTLRGVSRLPAVSDETRQFFLAVWLRHGDHIRQETHDDLALAAGLRMLLPPYDGPAVLLYRGETAWNRKRRTYGLSWTKDRIVAESFAQGMARHGNGGSVLLETDVSPDAIICASNEFGEDEHLVDRRRLGRVSVLRRFSQLAPS
jgi:hypothetical protein